LKVITQIIKNTEKIWVAKNMYNIVKVDKVVFSEHPRSYVIQRFSQQC